MASRQGNVEHDIERSTITVHGRFWAFVIEYLAATGQIDAADFLARMADFTARPGDMTAMERSIVDAWRKQIESGSHAHVQTV